MMIFQDKKIGLFYALLFTLELVTGNSFIKQKLCSNNEQLSQETLCLLSDKQNKSQLHNRIFNFCDRDPCFIWTQQTNNLNEFIASLLSFKRVSVIYEQDTFIDTFDIQNREDDGSLPIVKTFSLTLGKNYRQNILDIFEVVNVHAELKFLIVGSVKMFTHIMETAQHADKYLNQHGYFTKLHKWIFIDRSNNPCTSMLLMDIGQVDNVVCVQEDLSASAKPNSMIHLYTAMYGQTTRYWQEVYQSSHHKESIPFPDDRMFPNVKFGLNNKRVVIGTQVFPKYVDYNNGTLTGMYVEIMRDFAKFMNFTYEVHFPADGKWGALKSDGRWSGVVGQLEKREADFVVASLGVSFRRRTVIDYPDFDLQRTRYVGVYKMPKPETNSLRMYLLPFSKIVWILIVVAIVTTALLHTITTMYINSDLNTYDANIFSSKRKSTSFRLIMQRIASSLTNSFFCILSTFLRQTYQSTEPEKRRQKIIFGSFWVFGGVIVTLWSADIISYLSVSIEQRPIKTFDDLLNQDTYKFGTISGALLADSLSASNRTLEKTIWTRMKLFEKDDPDVLSSNITTVMNKVLDGNFVQFEVLETAMLLVNKHCDVALMDDAFMELGLNMALQDHSVFKPDLNDFVLRMSKGGITDKMYRQNFLADATCEERRPKATHRPMTLAQLSPILYVILVLISISVLVYLIEIFIYLLSAK